MPAFNHRRHPWVLIKEGFSESVTEKPPEWIILTADDWDISPALNTEINSSYTLFKEFQVEATFFGLKFPRLSLTQHSGIGQIGLRISIYKRK